MTFDDVINTLIESALESKLGIKQKNWVPYEGPSGGSGWKNTDTGDVHYGDSAPEPTDAVDDTDLESAIRAELGQDGDVLLDETDSPGEALRELDNIDPQMARDVMMSATETMDAPPPVTDADELPEPPGPQASWEEVPEDSRPDYVQDALNEADRQSGNQSSPDVGSPVDETSPSPTTDVDDLPDPPGMSASWDEVPEDMRPDYVQEALNEAERQSR